MNSIMVLLDQIRSGKATVNTRKFAAQGLLPVPEEQQISIQVCLTRDTDPEISEIARESLKKIHDDNWVRLCERKEPDFEIVNYCLTRPEFSVSVKERILLNHSVSDEIIAAAALRESGVLLDLIIQNQVRLLRSHSIFENLKQNPHVTIDQKRRLEEFETEFVFKKQPVAVPAEDVSKLGYDDILARIPNLEAEVQKLIRDADQKKEEDIPEELVRRTLENLFTTEELSEIPEETLTTYQRILRMKTGEKLRTALLGNKDERSILIRDTSKAIGSLVLRNPKLTDPELESYSQSRSLDSDLLRQMGQNKAFVKKYTVVHHLVKNPKTPSPVSLNLLKLLREMDLRNIARDRNIPDLIRRQAKRIYEQKEASHR